MLRIFKIVTLLVAFMATSTAFAKKSAVNIFEISSDVPKTEIMHQSGKTYQLSDFKGEFVVAVFWTKTCGPCIKELKDLNTFAQSGLKEGIRLILISPEKDWTSTLEQKRFLKKYGAPDVEFYTDHKGKLAADFGIFTTPHTVLIDEESQEIGRIRGTAKWGDKRILDYIKNLKKN